MKKFTLILLWIIICSVGAFAQSRSVTLSIHVQTAIDDEIRDQPVLLEQTDYAVSYGTLKLDENGNCTVKIYPGNHRITVDRAGYDTATKTFFVDDAAKSASVDLTLVEKTRAPFALRADVEHDVFSGRNDVMLSWNVEAPVFTDDFESYSPFAISFGQWTGIDADGEATAALQGTYPNRGVMQYAQIINPLAVVPTWWYDYPILQPYGGKQYLGFIRTESGRANDDWLISPAITPGTSNELSFMAKAADRYAERFMVYVTTKTDNPTADDFIRIDRGNFESVDYRGWQKFVYDLSDYAGKEIKFAIRYIGEANRYGAFMLMIDDVYVGQAEEASPESVRKAMRAAYSPANPYESFKVFVDDKEAGTTADYSFTLSDISSGKHTVGIQACYRNAVSEISQIEVDVPEGPFAMITMNVTANSILAADKVPVTILDLASGKEITLTTDKGAATIKSLPHGEYSLHIDRNVYEEYSTKLLVDGDKTLEIELSDYVVAPFNITADIDDSANTVTLRWNRELGFKDSFENYDDFATGSFGGWTSIDVDQMPVYPIGLGSTSNIVTFPGSGNATNPAAIPPMVFNPWKTVPAMLPTDQAIEAPDGQKSIIFFSPQMAKADKWLISPPVDIRQGYELTFKGKAYSSMYPESIEVYISLGGSDIGDFVMLGQIERLTSELWGEYKIDLSEYADEIARFGFRYTSYDAFLAQIDDVRIAGPEGEEEFVDYGNVEAYEVYLDGTKLGETTEPMFVASDVPDGVHTAGIVTRYKAAKSPMTEYTFGVNSGLDSVVVDDSNDAPVEIFDLSGRRLNDFSAPGVYIIRQGNKVSKIRK